jgi:class 3 adenylate cyclase/CheY-like chemotaxis protein
MSDDPRSPKKSLLHDLRTPLNQILGYSEMLEEEAQDLGQPGFVDTLRKVQTATRHLNTLLSEAFDPAKGGAPPALASGSAAPLISARTDDQDGDAERQKGEGTLLVVDDNEMNRDMLSRRLKTRGYTVSIAEGGRRALEMLGAEPYDLVLLDIMMPEVSGLDVLRALRQTHSRAERPVIMVTAKDQSEDIVEALKLGANDYVTKPIDLPVILARIEAQLSLKRAMEEIRRLAHGLEIRNAFIQKTFGRYLSDEVVDSLLESAGGLKLGGEKRDVTILMSDLRGFTSLAERLSPEEVVQILNGYLASMVDIIAKHRGTIDEFIGDAILVLFGAPVCRDDDARRAVACALEMQLAMAAVNERHRKAGLPEVEMGIALNTGPVVVGNIGSERRAKYGVVGSHVNLTSRIESYTVGGQILISDATRAAAGADVELGRPIAIQAKGFDEPVTAFSLLGIGGDYALRLPRRDETLVPLSRELPVRFSVVEGKRIGDARQIGAFVRLSAGGAELRCSEPLPQPFTNLLMHLQGPAGEDLPGKLYGKVGDGVAPSGGVLLRFTSVPPDVGRRLKTALAQS